MADPWKRKEVFGDATLYLGDCLEVMAAMPDASLDMIWTDPPYGHGNHDGDWNGRLNEHRGIENKAIANDDEESMRAVVGGMLEQAARILKPDCCCCGGGGPKPSFAWLAQRMDTGGFSFFHSVIWDKLNPGLGWRYRRQHEMVMVAHRAGGKLLWSNEDTAISNVMRIGPPRYREHPNEKPLELAENFIAAHARPDSVVLDPFMGSGVAGMACGKLGIRFIGIEIEPKYFDIACRRIDLAMRQTRMPIEGI